MKTKWMILAGILLVLGIVFIPTATAQTTPRSQSAFEAQSCDLAGGPQGNRQGMQDGTRGENRPQDGRGQGPRDGSGARRGERRGDCPQDGSGNGPRHGQRGGPRDGSGPNCPN